MSALSTAELTAIRSELESQMLPDTCNILTGTLIYDGAGGATTTWGTTYASIACRLDFSGGNEQVMAGKLTPYSRGMLTLPSTAVVTTESRVTHSSNTYAVIDVDNDKSWAFCRRCTVEKV